MRCAGRTRARRRGLTLIELMLTMGLLALVIGVGLGSLASLNPGQRAAVGLVQDVLRTAHNTAIARRAPARVRIDPARGTLVAQGMRVVGTWHFESVDLAGGGGLDGVAIGSDDLFTDDGFIGKGVDFSRAPRGVRIEVPVQDDPIFDLREGFAIDVAIRAERLAGSRLLTLGDAFEAELRRDGSVLASFRRSTTDEIGRTGTGVRVGAATAAGAVREGRWVLLRFLYDLRALRIFVDGMPVAATFVTDRVGPLAGPLEIGGGQTPFPGKIDELVIAVVVGDEASALPRGVTFSADTARTIEFVAGGALDPSVHPAPVDITLEFEEGGRERVRVGLFGTVE